jgi:hypothetical protein
MVPSSARSFRLCRRRVSGEPVTLYFSPAAPAGVAASRWIQTIPGTGWFVYFRIYGPGAPAFDGTWQLPDFTRTAGSIRE